MSRTWVVFDVSYLAHRAFYTTGRLSFEDKPTGVVFGILRDIKACVERFKTEHIIFCFDHGKGLREQTYPWYKETRRKKKMTDQEAEAKEGMRSQIDLLRTVYLKEIGYSNVVWQTGYEADDLMAAIQFPDEDRAVLVTGDEDMYQVLSRQVAVYHPKSEKLVTVTSFRLEKKIDPYLWVSVKALAGCPGDDVAGMPGVGEKTAIKYFTGELKGNPQLCRKIKLHRQSKEYRQDLELVKLPYPGCKPVRPKPDAARAEAWDELCSRLGMDSLLVGADGFVPL